MTERKRTGLDAELQAAGFSARTINALLYRLDIQSLDELKTVPWGSVKDRSGLAWRLRFTPGIGKKGFAEVEAFRAGRHPQSAYGEAPPGAKPVLPRADS